MSDIITVRYVRPVGGVVHHRTSRSRGHVAYVLLLGVAYRFHRMVQKGVTGECKYISQVKRKCLKNTGNLNSHVLLRYFNTCTVHFYYFVK